MFTLIGIGLIVGIAFLMEREKSKDSWHTEDYVRYTQQHTRAVMWLLGAVVILLGIIADRIH